MLRILGPDASVSEVVRAAQQDGADVVVVPAGTTKRDSLALFAEALELPDWFGHNLDALADCLHDLAEGLQGRREVVWDGVGILRAEDPSAFEAILGILDEVQQDHPRLAVTVLDR